MALTFATNCKVPAESCHHGSMADDGELNIATNSSPTETERLESATDESEQPPSELGSEASKPAQKPRAPKTSDSFNPTEITNQDPRLVELEPLVASGNWAAVTKELGPADGVGRLPPHLGLIYAVACKESESDTKEPKCANVNEVAIRCMANLMGVRSGSPLALVLAKRILRTNPVSWQQRPAPSARVSIFIILLGLAVGALVGWMLSFGYITVNVGQFKHLLDIVQR